jgi:hypothetical protein
MPCRIEVIRSRDFVRMDPHGRINLDESREVLRKLAQTCRERSIDRALIDVRDVESRLTVSDVFYLAHDFGTLGFENTCHLAFLYLMDVHKNAKFFELCANNRGWIVRVFEDFEKAFTWLNQTDNATDSETKP